VDVYKVAFSLDYVNSIFEDKGCKLINYTKSKEPVTYVASCGHENTLSSLRSFIASNGTCTVCAKKVAGNSIKKELVDVDSIVTSKGMVLINYKGKVTLPITCKCRCGHEYTFSCLRAIKDGDGLCRSCSAKATSGIKKHFKDVEQIFIDKGCKLIDFTGAKSQITYIASCGHENKLSGLNQFVKSSTTLCKVCENNIKKLTKIKDISEVKELFRARGCELLEYTSASKKITYKASCGHITSVARLDVFVGGKNSDKCESCKSLVRLDYEYVNSLVKANKCTLVGMGKNNNWQTVEIIPSCNHGTKEVTMTSIKLGHSTLCSVCSHTTSKCELEVKDFISQLTEVKERQRILGRYEIDILVPEFNLGVEFDGIYWHTESNGKHRTYHVNKTNLAREIGISLIHIFENEWVLKPEIVKSILLSKLGKTERIFARNTEVREVSSKESFSFLETSHRQGGINGGIRLGLYLNDELVALMVFGKSRFGKQQYELLRYCNKLNITVVGGAGKLLKAFERTYLPNSLVSYADLRYSKGNMYGALGFTLSHNSPPNYWYFKEGSLILESRVKYQKHKLKNVLKTFDSNKTEYENMLENGYQRIWDCGNAVFTKHYKGDI